MRALALVLLSLSAAACGTAVVTRTVTVTGAPQGTAQQLQAPDPTLDAQCVQQPNRQPTCSQGSYAVSITIGAPCSNPSIEPPSSWQFTYDGSQTARCMTNP